MPAGLPFRARGEEGLTPTGRTELTMSDRPARGSRCGDALDTDSLMVEILKISLHAADSMDIVWDFGEEGFW